MAPLTPPVSFKFHLFSTIDSPESSNPSNRSNAFALVPLSIGIVKSFEIVTTPKNWPTHLHSTSEIDLLWCRRGYNFSWC